MKIKQDLFGAIGLNEHAPIKSLLIVIIFLASIGIFTDGIADIIEHHNFTKFFISIVMFLIVYIGYYFLGQQELKIVKELSSDKEIMILVTPSNVNHLMKIIKVHNIHTLYILKEKNFPSNEQYNAIKAFLKEKNITLHEYILNSLENPKELQYQFQNILAQLNSTKNLILNVSTGKSSTSIILFELAQFEKIGVEYLSSEYDENNKPITGTEQNYKINFYKEFSRR